MAQVKLLVTKILKIFKRNPYRPERHYFRGRKIEQK